MNTPPTQVPFDYIFDLVIRRMGYYYMSYTSPHEWEKHHPKLRQRLEARGIGIKEIDSSFVKFGYHASSVIHSN